LIRPGETSKLKTLIGPYDLARTSPAAIKPFGNDLFFHSRHRIMKLTTALFAIAACAQIALASPMDPRVASKPSGPSTVRHRDHHQSFAINNDGTRVAPTHEQRGVSQNGIGTGYMIGAPVDTHCINGVDGADIGGAADCGCGGCSIM
jgi:hypothetical protein